MALQPYCYLFLHFPLVPRNKKKKILKNTGEDFNKVTGLQNYEKMNVIIFCKIVKIC